MEKKMSMNCLVLLLVLGLCQMSVASMEKKNVEKKTYIVHMAKSEMPESFDDHTHWYDSSLKSMSDSAEMLYTYSNAAHGFSTRLTADEARSLENQPGILSVLPEMKYELHTTRSPQFLGLDNTTNLFPELNSVSEVIVGVLPTPAYLVTPPGRRGGWWPAQDLPYTKYAGSEAASAQIYWRRWARPLKGNLVHFSLIFGTKMCILSSARLPQHVWVTHC